MTSARQRSSTALPDDVNPFTLALQLPLIETPAQRATRLREEAKAISDKIDDQIRTEREGIKERLKNNDVKILLLGKYRSSLTLSVAPAHAAKPDTNLQANPNPESLQQLRISKCCILPVLGSKNASPGEL